MERKNKTPKRKKESGDHSEFQGTQCVPNRGNPPTSLSAIAWRLSSIRDLDSINTIGNNWNLPVWIERRVCEIQGDCNAF